MNDVSDHVFDSDLKQTPAEVASFRKGAEEQHTLQVTKQLQLEISRKLFRETGIGVLIGGILGLLISGAYIWIMS